MSIRGARGFTIVELLIVIVVIAILAAITIVAYRSIQERARTSVVLNATQAWEKSIQRAFTDGFDFATYGSTCLGSAATDFPAKDGFGAGVCVTLNGSPAITYDSSVLAGWPTTTTRQNGLLPITTVKSSGFDLRARGIWIEAADSAQRSFYIGWAPQTVGNCGNGYSVVDGGSVLAGSYCNKLINY